MKVAFEASSLRGTSWHQYALRFVLGGLVTVGAGVIAKLWGPVIGGLFLAFPAIFPAGVTLIASRECKKKTRAGLKCGRRGHRVAALDAAGAILGNVGLLGFAAWVWHEVTRSAPATFLGAPVLWGLISLGLWRWRKKHTWRNPQPAALDGSRTEWRR